MRQGADSPREPLWLPHLSLRPFFLMYEMAWGQENDIKMEDGRCSHEEPIIINSAYRSPQVNKAVGGAPTSNHLTGCAVDIHCLGKEQAIRYACILLDISDESQEVFDELLIEQSSKSIWVHFAVRPEGNRRKVEFIKK